jgi:hypothetical protein
MSFSITITGNINPFNKLMMYKQEVNFIGHSYPKKTHTTIRIFTNEIINLISSFAISNNRKLD